MPSYFNPKKQSTAEVFKLIQDYQQLNFNQFIKQLLLEKKIKTRELHEMLNQDGYYLSRESLYRYFNNNPKSNRFPSQDFLYIFAKLLQLTEEQTRLLILFWKYCKLIKKCTCNSN